MKYRDKKVLTVYLATTLVFVLSVSFATAQKSSISTTENKADEIRLREHYEFTIGREINYSLMSNCSIYLGIIEAVESDVLHLTVSEPLSNVAAIGNSAIVPIRRSSRPGYSPWRNADFTDADLTIGSRLLIADCRGYIRVAVSDQSLFESIRKAISFDHLLANNPEEIREIPEDLRTSKDYVFAGYAIDMLWRRNLDRDSQAFVLSTILAGENVTATGFAFARITLRRLLAYEGELAVSNQARYTSFLNLVNGVVDGKGATDEIFSLFCELAVRDKLDISSFLGPTTRETISDKFADYQPRDRTGCTAHKRLSQELKAP